MATATVTPGYNWVSGEVVTPAKMNNAAAPTVAISNIVNADIGSGAAIALSKLATGALPSAITVAPANLAAGVAGTGPAFRAGAATSTGIPNETFTKIELTSETFDTNSNFVSSRFTPTVAGYYQITGAFRVSALGGATGLVAMIYKNGSVYSHGAQAVDRAERAAVSDIVYLNGTTDYVELWGYHYAGSTRSTTADATTTYMSGCLIRN